MFGGRVVLDQPTRGYRVNADALILADFSRARPRGKLFDLGAGVGSIALVMLARGHASRAALVEQDEDMCAFAKKNAEANGARVEVFCGDVLDVAHAHRGEADAVVCNPPYFEKGTARERDVHASARVGDLERFVRAARELLGRRGRAHFVYPAHSSTRLFQCFASHGLEPKRARFVHADAASPARVVLVMASASKPGGLVVDPPLLERDDEGAYTEEMRRALGLDFTRRANDRARSRTPRAR